ncbi:MAG TPA: phosphoribosylaminoimidazolesuccinocarboxamide synthase, partial [Thermomicrobiales bacterium]|nr:phosphoribosylaminoimidazolesuccinocarboxamide synthase [Thermomicrobiales bacterium]
FRRGKVRDVFDLGDRLLIVATDRLSAFDVVLPTPIPQKGAVLTAISNGWFARVEDIVPNHLTGDSVLDLEVDPQIAELLRPRSSIVRKAERIDIECVVRGNIAGSGWKEYGRSGTLADETLPPGLQLGDELPEPRFTPAAKNDVGHDENISRASLRNVIGGDLANQLEATSLALFDFARQYAARAGFILADTKFEFGFVDGELTLIDEALTPDSSRYWDAAGWQRGFEPPSFDKQIIRDWLEQSGWNKEAPGPEVPASVVRQAAEKYRQVYLRLRAVEEAEQQ